MALFAVVWLWAVTGDAFGQTTWREFVSKEDRFGANFPGEPVVTQITWHVRARGGRAGTGLYRDQRPRQVFDDRRRLQPGKEPAHREGEKLSARLERCLGRTAFSGDGYWKNDLRGAMLYAAFQYIKRDFKVNHYMWNHLGMGVEVNELQMTNQRRSIQDVRVPLHAPQRALRHGRHRAWTLPAAWPVHPVDLAVRGGRHESQPREGRSSTAPRSIRTRSIWGERAARVGTRGSAAARCLAPFRSTFVLALHELVNEVRLSRGFRTGGDDRRSLRGGRVVRMGRQAFRRA